MTLCQDPETKAKLEKVIEAWKTKSEDAKVTSLGHTEHFALLSLHLAEYLVEVSSSRASAAC